jgi:hypothetical protein
MQFMPKSQIAYSIDPDRNRIEGSAQGFLDFEDFDLHMQELIQDPSFYSGIDGLYDFTLVKKIKGDPSFFERTSEQITDKNVIQDSAKVAIVIGENTQLKGIFSGWKVMMSFTLISYETFRTRKEANTWLAN